MKRPDLSSLLVFGATILSMFVGRDFFFGMLLFMINYVSFRFIIKMMFASNEDEVKALKRYIFIPAIFLKFAAIAIVTYIVLVSLSGSAVWYVGGFGAGLLVFTIAVVADHYFGRAFGRKS